MRSNFRQVKKIKQSRKLTVMKNRFTHAKFLPSVCQKDILQPLAV